VVGTSTRVRLGRDYYVRIAGNDYSVDPTVIGRFVDVHAGLTVVTVSCAGLPVGRHDRCWTTRRTITDPAHVVTAGVLRTAFKERTAAMRGPVAAAGAVVGVRALSDYDELFDLATPGADAAPRPDLRIVR
jgi:hypothetical protein